MSKDRARSSSGRRPRVISGTEGGGKLRSRADINYVRRLVKLGKYLLFYNDEIGLRKRKAGIVQILFCFVEQNTPPNTSRNIAKEVDEYVAPMLEHGMPPENAVTVARKICASLVGKTFDAVKTAHIRYGIRKAAKSQKSKNAAKSRKTRVAAKPRKTKGVAKSQKLPR